MKNNTITLLKAPNAQSLMNANTPEDAASVQSIISQQMDVPTLPDFSRYSCQMILPGFGELTQRVLSASHVLIIGAGGLGCPAAQYLTAAGVGNIGIADFDIVSTGNLHRQILYRPDQVGLKKVAVASTTLQLQNPGINIIPHDIMFSAENIMDVIKDYEIVLDCTDNFETRYLINDACVIAGKPLVHGAIYQYEGHVATWNVSNDDGSRSPNYRDVFPDVNAAQVPNCAEGGVFPTLAGIIGSMVANETLKLISGNREVLSGKMLVFDALTLQSRIIKTGERTNTTITTLPSFPAIPKISAAEVKSNMGHYILIDVRTPEEHQENNIGGVNIPLSEIEDIATYLSAEKTIVVYCASGRRSAEAIRIINMLFIADIRSLDGGINAW